MLDVAPRLVGWTVSTDRDGGLVSVRLTEVEAYDGANDPASHAFRGPTERNAPMFGPAGAIYVYRSYGVHWCMNLVTGSAETASAVLLRGGEVVEGVCLARKRRDRTDHLADGPGKLCQALGVTGADSGSSIGQSVYLSSGQPGPRASIEATPRIGISRAAERPWRFVEVPESTHE